MDVNRKGESVSHIVIGNILKTQRSQNDITQSEIAQVLGYRNLNFVSMIESGRSNIPINKILKLVKAYGLDGEFALSIIRELHPDIWSLIVDIVTQNKKAFINIEKLDAEIDKSLIDKLMALKLDNLVELITKNTEEDK